MSKKVYCSQCKYHCGAGIVFDRCERYAMVTVPADWEYPERSVPEFRPCRDKNAKNDCKDFEAKE